MLSQETESLPFCMNIIDIEEVQHYPLKNWDDDVCKCHGEETRRVPILRIYGSTPSGQKATAIVHGVYPYFYVNIPKPIELKCISNEDLASLCLKLATAIDDAVTLQFNSDVTYQAVYTIIPVKAKSVYGFALQEEVYLKVFLLNGKLTQQIATLLRNGAILGHVFEIYEAHIPYSFQFLIDYNLFGMNWIKFSDVRFRVPLPVRRSHIPIRISVDNTYTSHGLPNFSRYWDVEGVDFKYTTNLKRCTTSDIEIDVHAIDIMNINEKKPPSLSNDSKILHTLDFLWSEEKIRRLQESGNDDSLEVFSDLHSYYESGGDDISKQIVHPLRDALLDKLIALEKEHLDRKPPSDPHSSQIETSSNEANVFISTSSNELNTSFERGLKFQTTPPSNIPLSHMKNMLDTSFYPASQYKTKSKDEEGIQDLLEVMEMENYVSSDDDKIENEALNESGDIMASQRIIEEQWKVYNATKDEEKEEELLKFHEEIQEEEETEFTFSKPEIPSTSQKPSQPLDEAVRNGKLNFDDLFSYTTQDKSLLKLQRLKKRKRVTQFVYSVKPPTLTEIFEDIDQDIPVLQNTQPFIDPKDTVNNSKSLIIGEKPIVNPTNIHELPLFYSGDESIHDMNMYWESLSKTRSRVTGEPTRVLVAAKDPPTIEEVQLELDRRDPEYISKIIDNEIISQLARPTPKNMYGFDLNPSQKKTGINPTYEGLTLLSVEIFATSREDLHPNPNIDAIQCIYCCIREDQRIKELGSTYKDQVDVLTLSKQNITDPDLGVCRTYQYDNELELLHGFIEYVHKWNPDAIIGYDIQSYSLGYILERASALGIEEALNKLSRSLTWRKSKGNGQFKNMYEILKFSGIIMPGRIIMNLWRIVRRALHLQSYTYENIAYHVLHKRVPFYDFKHLTRWFSSKDSLKTHLYFIDRVLSNLEILDVLNVVPSTCEFARLYGILFYSVISRGSQFKIESMLLRITKPLNFICLSASSQMVAHQMAPVAIPLVLEPKSLFYFDPVLVLDFRSLYPSIMQAYNLCYSTCLGRISPGEGEENSKRLGVTSYSIPRGSVEALRKYIYVAPNDVMYVRKEVMTGVLPRMVREILETRYMIKQSMKQIKDHALKDRYEQRQQALKLFATVIYGYAGASFHGRMPCVDIADSIVQIARATLERAIRCIDGHPTWGSKVVYGDTDSVFVHLKGANKEQAFKIGREIADRVTNDNPWPMKLNFEKCYSQCVLLTKKRYCGYKYTSVDQDKPEFEGKGIETMRRDSCPVVAKIMEKSIRLLFETKDISSIKKFVRIEFNKILRGKASLEDFIFRKEVKMHRYVSKTLPPAAMVAMKEKERDPRRDPHEKAVVPYVVTLGPPESRLIDLVCSPREFLENPGQLLNAHYYITKQIIPAVSRVFELMQVDIYDWYKGMSRKVLTPMLIYQSTLHVKKKDKIYHYFSSQQCIICNGYTCDGQKICSACHEMRQFSHLIFLSKLKLVQKDYVQTKQICMQCESFPSALQIECFSLDCPILFQRMKVQDRCQAMEAIQKEFME